MQVGAAKPATITTNAPIISQYAGRDPITPAIYTPSDIGALHKATETSITERLTKGPLNFFTQSLAWAGRLGTACIAGVGAVLTALSAFLFGTKMTILFALPTLAALAAYIGLKPKEELHTTLKVDNQNLLEQIASDAEDAKPQYILSRPDGPNGLIAALQNARNNWGSVALEKRPALLKTIENLKGKILPIVEIYKDLATRGKDGLAQMFPGCSLEKLNTMLDLLNETSTDLGAHLARKTAKIEGFSNN